MSPDPASDPHDWRPQAFGDRRAQQLRDPIVEPLWDGDRVLVHVGHGGVEIIDIEGIPVEAVPEIAAAVGEAVRAERLVLDGYLTPQASRTGQERLVGEVEIPTATQMTAQMFLGRVRERKRELQDAPPPEVRPGDLLVFVAVDLLALDDRPLLDLPLLERKRLLESVLEESLLVRRGLYVRPPIDPWIGAWRAQGFRAMAFKEANGRYRPGEKSPTWASAQIPVR